MMDSTQCAAVTAVWDDYVRWRRQGVTITVDQSTRRLHYRVPDGVDVAVLRAWLAKHKPALLLLLAGAVPPVNPDVPGEDDGGDLVRWFLDSEFTHDALLDVLLCAVTEKYGREYFPALPPDVSVTAADRVVRLAIDLHADEFPDRRSYYEDQETAELARALHWAVSDARPDSGDLREWMRTAYWIVAAKVTPWLLAHHCEIEAEIERSARQERQDAA